MRLGWLIIFFAVFSYPITISAQTPCEDIGITDPLGFNTILDEPNNNIIDVGDQFCLDFTTENFNFVVGWQFTMAFDPTIFNFIFFQQTPNVLLGPIAPNTFQAENGVLSFIWTNLNAEGQTLSDDTTIFTICFEAIGEPNDCSPFYFNDDYPFFPELEVNYQIDENTNCSDTILLINGQPATEIKIACTDLTIVDLKTCAVGPSSGSLSFSACGGDLPYTYEISNNANPVVLNGTINSDGEEAFFPTVPTAVYTIVVTDNMGNQTTRVVNIENGSPIEYDTALLEPNCPEAETGKIVIRDIRGGVPGISGYTMTASTGQFFQNTFSDSLIRLSNGDYTITIIDDNGCEVTETFTLSTPEINLVIEVDTASCTGAMDGAVRVFPSGGTPFTGGEYIINGVRTTSFETNMPFQDPAFFDLDNRLVVTIEDANGCMREERIEIPVRQDIEMEFLELVDVACKGDTSGSARILVTTPGRYVFLLTDEIGAFVPAIGSVIGNVELFYDMTLPAGFYNLTIRDTEDGCELDTFFVINEPAEEFTVTNGGIAPECNQNNGIAFVIPNGGMMPYSYDWMIAPGIDNDTLYDLLPGVYNVVVTDALGCSRDMIVNVPQGDELDIAIDIVSSLECDGTGQGTLALDIIENTFSDIDIMWTNTNGDMLGNMASLDFNGPGEYILNVSNQAGTCSDSDTVFIDPAGIFTFEITFTDPSCSGANDGSISIGNFMGGVGPYNCDWEDSSITDCNPTDLVAGIYNLTISDDAGCQIDTFVELSDTAAEITFDIDVMQPSCVEAIDGSISFQNFAGGVGPYECMWEDPTVMGCPRTGLAAGIYPVTIIDAVGCQKDTIIILEDPEAIEIDVAAVDVVAVTCFEGSDGQATVTITNNPQGLTDYNYAWSNPADDGSGGLSFTATNLSAGQNFVIAFDDNSCASDTFFFNVQEPPALSLDLGITLVSSAICFGSCDGAADLVATGGTSMNGSYSFLWEDGSTASSRNDLCPGTYFITITDDNNCEHVDSILIVEPDTLDMSIDLNGTVDLSCFGDDTGAIQVSTQGGCGGYSYAWSGNVSTSERADNLPQGMYTITVTDDCGCTDTASYDLIASEPIIADLIDPGMPECFGGTTCIGVSNATGGVGNNYTFSINFGERIPIGECVEVIAGNYTILVFDAAGCSEEYMITVNQPDMIEVDLGPDITLNLGDTSTVISADIIANNPIANIDWMSSSGFQCQNGDCSSIVVNTSTFASYEVVVTDINGCSGQDRIEVSISAQRNVYVPNTFNPNDLPPNNKFMLLTGDGAEQLEFLRIFDRWGNLVYEVEGLNHPTNVDDGWNGRRNNNSPELLEQGVYVFVAQIRFVDDRVINYSGDITLLR